MPITKTNLLDRIEHGDFDYNVMVMLAAMRKQSRLIKKTVDVPLFILSNQGPYPTVKDGFNALYDSLDIIPDKTRFQLAIELTGHWSFVDIQINKKLISYFMLDAGLDIRHYAIKYLLKSYFPKNIDREYFLQERIQYDDTQCAVFVYDHATFLSQKNIFSFLKTEFCDAEQKVTTLNHRNLPPELAGVYRGIQSLKAFVELSSHIKEAPVNNKQQLLYQLVDANAGTSKTTGKIANLTIDYKKQRLQEKLYLFVDSLDQNDIENIILKNSLVDHLNFFSQLPTEIKKLRSKIANILNLFDHPLEIDFLTEFDRFISSQNNFKDISNIVKNTLIIALTVLGKYSHLEPNAIKALAKGIAFDLIALIDDNSLLLNLYKELQTDKFDFLRQLTFLNISRYPTTQTWYEIEEFIRIQYLRNTQNCKDITNYKADSLFADDKFTWFTNKTVQEIYFERNKFKGKFFSHDTNRLLQNRQSDLLAEVSNIYRLARI